MVSIPPHSPTNAWAPWLWLVWFIKARNAKNDISCKLSMEESGSLSLINWLKSLKKTNRSMISGDANNYWALGFERRICDNVWHPLPATSRYSFWLITRHNISLILKLVRMYSWFGLLSSMARVRRSSTFLTTFSPHIEDKSSLSWMFAMAIGKKVMIEMNNFVSLSWSWHYLLPRQNNWRILHSFRITYFSCLICVGSACCCYCWTWLKEMVSSMANWFKQSPLKSLSRFFDDDWMYSETRSRQLQRTSWSMICDGYVFMNSRHFSRIPTPSTILLASCLYWQS